MFLGVLDKHAPMKKRLKRNKSNPWMNTDIKKLMLSRDALRQKAIKSGHITDWDEYRSMRNKVTNAIKTTKAKYYQDKLLS